MYTEELFVEKITKDGGRVGKIWYLHDYLL